MTLRVTPLYTPRPFGSLRFTLRDPSGHSALHSATLRVTPLNTPLHFTHTPIPFLLNEQFNLSGGVELVYLNPGDLVEQILQIDLHKGLTSFSSISKAMSSACFYKFRAVFSMVLYSLTSLMICSLSFMVSVCSFMMLLSIWVIWS